MRKSKGDVIAVDERTLNVLSRVRCTRNIVHRFEESLDRTDYLKLNEALEALGGKWTKASKALPDGGHVFPDGVDAAGDLAARIADEVGAAPGRVILEPSAGLGRLALAARDSVVCVERDESRATTLARHGGVTVLPDRDFLAMFATP